MSLEGELAKIRTRGWANAPEESVTGLNALAAPVFARNGILVGALAIIGALQFVPAEPHDDQVREVCSCARRASDALGGASA